MGFEKSVMASRIRARRAELDLTQQQLADASGIALTTVSSYEDENGFVPSAERVFALSEALGVEPNWLMGWDGKASSKSMRKA